MITYFYFTSSVVNLQSLLNHVYTSFEVIGSDVKTGNILLCTKWVSKTN